MIEDLNKRHVKGNNVRTVSLTDEDEALCRSLNISLSGILRAKIQEIRKDSENWEKLIVEKDEKITKLANLVREQAEKINVLEEK